MSNITRIVVEAMDAMKAERGEDEDQVVEYIETQIRKIFREQIRKRQENPFASKTNFGIDLNNRQ